MLCKGELCGQVIHERHGGASKAVRLHVAQPRRLTRRLAVAPAWAPQKAQKQPISGRRCRTDRSSRAYGSDDALKGSPPATAAWEHQ